MSFFGSKKYRPKTIEECILPEDIKKTFQGFLSKGEVPNLLLSGPAGCGKTTVAKALCHELGADYYVINGSDEGRFLDTVRNTAKISLRPYHFRQLLDTKSSSSMRRITQQTAYNSYLGRLQRSFLATAGLSSPATSKTKSSNHFIPVALWLNSELGENKNQQSLCPSPNEFKKYLMQSESNMTQKSSMNSSTNTSQTGEESSTNVNDTLPLVRLIQEFLQRSVT